MPVASATPATDHDARYSSRGSHTVTDEQHAVLGAERVGEHLAVVDQGGGRGDRAQFHAAAGHVGAPLHHLTFGQGLHQSEQRGCVGVEFEHQLQRAAAGQAEAVGFVGADAVGHALGRAVGNLVRDARHVGAGIGLVGAAVAVDQVVFDAATRDRADHRAALAQRHDGAHRAR
jgi:hypothetical protein